MIARGGKMCQAPAFRANPFRFLQKKAIVPYPGEGKDMEIAAKKIEEMEKSLWGEHGQRRQPGNLRHELADILAIAFAALLCGLKDYEDRENLGREKEGWFRTFLELPNGIPDKNTFQRIFTWIKPVELMNSL
jgi:hypothetical protein